MFKSLKSYLLGFFSIAMLVMAVLSIFQSQLINAQTPLAQVTPENIEQDKDAGTTTTTSDTSYSSAKCESNKIDYTNLFVLTKNIPVVPEGCGWSDDEGVQPIPPQYIGDIALRIYAFFISFVFNSLAIVAAVVGITILVQGYTSDASNAATEFLKKKLPVMLWGLVLVLFAYVVPISIFSLFGISVVKDFECIFVTEDDSSCETVINQEEALQNEMIQQNNRVLNKPTDPNLDPVTPENIQQDSE